MDWWQWLILFALVFVISYMLATLLDNRRERVERAAVAGAGLMLTGAGEEFDDQLDFAREIYRNDFSPRMTRSLTRSVTHWRGLPTTGRIEHEVN